MSLFGTFRKKGKKVPSSSKNNTIFSSTPNLYKVSVGGGSSSAGTSTSSWKDHEDDDYEHYDDESIVSHGDDESAFEHNKSTISEPACQPRYGEHSFNSSSLKKQPPERHNPGTGMTGIRSFMSMVSMASSLKRAKKPDKKSSFASATNLHRLDESERREAVIFEDHQNPSSTEQANDNSTMLKTIKSAPILGAPKNLKGTNDDENNVTVFSNTEPGVISSSSSTSSCNQSDTGSISSFRSNSTSTLPRSNKKRKDIKSGGSISSTNIGEIQYETSVNTKYVHDIKRTQLVLQGAKKFNMDPKRGIDFLVLNGIIERTPENVAQFLKDGEGLSKSAIGNYLGEYEEFNLNVLKSFVDLHDFTNVLLVQALRQFLWSFRLPGESQKIDRMMESFAIRYCQLNPSLFEHSDTCYLLSFAIIMLNTSLHNPSVKDKTTLEQFIRMTDDGHNLDRQFLTSLYNSIFEEPFKIPEEDGNDFMLTFFNPDIEGWLWKQGGGYKSWKRRWFILSNNCLYYFRFTTDRVPRGIIPLENIMAEASNSSSSNSKSSGKHNYCFTLYKKQLFDSHHLHVTDYIKSCKTLSGGQIIPGQHSSYNLATNSEEERTKWITAISQNSSSNDFYTFLAHKKSKLQAMTAAGSRRGTGSASRKSKTSSKAASVRKSQISLPLTTKIANLQPSLQEPFGDSSTVEYNYLDYLVNPEKNPHNYFLTLPSSKSTNMIATDSISSIISGDGDSGKYSSSGADLNRSGSEDDSFSRYSIEPMENTNRTSIDSQMKSSAADFLIKKYSLPIQASSTTILNKCEALRCDSIINTPDIKISLAGPDDVNGNELPKSISGTSQGVMNSSLRKVEQFPVFGNEIGLKNRMDSDKAKNAMFTTCFNSFKTDSTNSLELDSITDVVPVNPLLEHNIPLQWEAEKAKAEPDLEFPEMLRACQIPNEFVPAEDFDNLFSPTAKTQDVPNFDLTTSEQKDEEIHYSDENSINPASDDTESILTNKKSTFKKEKSLEKHVEEFPEKPNSSITTDSERIRASSNTEEIKKIQSSDRTLERVTSFTHSITTTIVTKSVQQSPITSDQFFQDPMSPPSEVSEACASGKQLHSDTKPQIDDEDEDESVGNSELNLVEAFNSVIIGNVRHTEV